MTTSKSGASHLGGCRQGACSEMKPASAPCPNAHLEQAPVLRGVVPRSASCPGGRCQVHLAKGSSCPISCQPAGPQQNHGIWWIILRLSSPVLSKTNSPSPPSISPAPKDSAGTAQGGDNSPRPFLCQQESFTFSRKNSYRI